MIRYTITIFLSAFLLFQVQPLIGKFVLPWFGGTPAVWTACMLFFQSLLVVGYAYAHGISCWLRPNAQVACHSILLILSATLLPITPDSSWKPTPDGAPTVQIFLLLLVNVGGPYILLASTAPLLQSWFAKVHSDQSPYRLYAFSNTGSLLGLFAYPFIVEHSFTLQSQTVIWSAAYGLFILMCGVCAMEMWNQTPDVDSSDISAIEAFERSKDIARPSPGTIALWLALSASGSVVLLATTNLMCQDVASVPFLWVLPLGLYLLSFILLFGNENLYKRDLFAVAMIVATFAMVALTLKTLSFSFVVQIFLYSGILTVACFVCHGELVHLKPSPRYLTLFYVVIAIGGALGGAFVALVAPLIFTGFYEFNAGLLACVGLLLLLYRRDRWRGMAPNTVRRQMRITAMGAILVAALALSSMSALSTATIGPDETYLARQRNFYGALRVIRRSENSKEHRRVVMIHGNTIHGVQLDLPSQHETPTLYYERQSGVGLTIECHPSFVAAKRPFRLGVVGLGAGAISCYGRSGDVIRYYEIDPLVVEFSKKYFTFQSDAERRGVNLDVFVGDARIVMERQLAQQQPQRFDVLVIDAFSSDSIPLHLLTRECFQIYRQHLHAEGVLAMHVSNRHLDLRPAIKSMAEHFGYRTMLIHRPPDQKLLQQGLEFASGSVWILLTENEEFVANSVIQEASQPWPSHMQPVMLTDDANSLFQLLHW